MLLLNLYYIIVVVVGPKNPSFMINTEREKQARVELGQAQLQLC